MTNVSSHGSTDASSHGGTDLHADSPEQRDFYRERAHHLTVIAARYRDTTRLAYNDPREPHLPVLYINTPIGQISYHLNPLDVELFTDIAAISWADPTSEADQFLVEWDGHDKQEAIKRLVLLTAFEAADPAHGQ